MSLHNLIFTTKSPAKYYRHILFWLTIYLFKSHSNTQDYNIGTQLIDMVYCYAIVYWVIPQFYFKKKYGSFIACLAAITLIIFIIRGVFFLWLYDYLYQGRDKIIYETWFHISFFIHSGPIMRCALMITFKILKSYYQKVKEKETLIKETNTAELQLLKAQVQPHFLFNTLNNIYSYTLNNSPKAADLILKLYDTINYMNRDCQSELVPLKKEVKMLHNYVGLEKVRYGKHLKIEVEINGDFENKLIAPLLLIPFVENSFKHGSSKMLEHPWIKMQIDVKDNRLNFKISNSVPVQVKNSNGKNGIGLANAKKRLELLYPGVHSLKLNETPDSYRVDLELPLLESVRPEQEHYLKIETEMSVPLFK